MKAMIFAAGLGTRLRPLTDRMPKALVEVAGKPLLQHQLERLRAAGATEVVINVHHFADMIEQWVREHPMGVSVRFSDERAMLLETGGAIRKARPLLGEGRVLIHNCDILSDAHLREFYDEGEHASATLLVSPRESSRYLLFDDDMQLRGWMNAGSGEAKYVVTAGSANAQPSVQPCAVSDVAHLQRYAFSGIHQIDSSVFPLMDGWPEKFSVIDFYLWLATTHNVRGVVAPHLHLIDVGKLDTLAQAEEFLRAQRASSL